MAKIKTSTQLVFVKSLVDVRDHGPDPAKTLLIFDKKLTRALKSFNAFSEFYPYRVGMVAGEELKDLRMFPQHFEQLMKKAKDVSPRELTVLAVGGGSIGDFAGFFASTFKRGVRLVHVPSTWLAAIDSAHGGKTALNVGDAKNQIGTFYPSEQTFLCRELLSGQPEKLQRDALGELIKIAIVDGGSWVSKFESDKSKFDEKLWNYLEYAIESKLKVVAKDPEEKNGARQVLNLGHTFGHVIEKSQGYSHGQAIVQGLFFALEMSEKLGLLKANSKARVSRLLEQHGLKKKIRPIAEDKARKLLLEDKKRSAQSEITFIAIRGIGDVSRETVSVEKFIEVAFDNGWVK